MLLLSIDAILRAGNVKAEILIVAVRIKVRIAKHLTNGLLQ